MGQPNPAPPITPPAPGATPPAEPPATGPAAPPATGDQPLGEAGQRALAEERAARKELEKQIKELEPLKKLAEAMGVKPDATKSNADALATEVATMRKELADERVGRMRAEVAAEAKLDPSLAKRLTGSTREELAADAAEMAKLFPAGAGNGTTTAPGTPAPDPSQGARGGVDTLQAALKAAQDKGDTKEAIRLKAAIFAASQR